MIFFSVLVNMRSQKHKKYADAITFCKRMQMVNDPTIKHANYLLQKFTNRVAEQYLYPIFKIRSDPVFRLWWDPDHVFKVWSDLDPVFNGRIRIRFSKYKRIRFLSYGRIRIRFSKNDWFQIRSEHPRLLIPLKSNVSFGIYLPKF